MEWSTATSRHLIVPRMNCNLIIIGVTIEGQPFCYENSFQLLHFKNDHMTVQIENTKSNPLEQLERICFVEFSFRTMGILYYSFVECVKFKSSFNICTLTFKAPKQLNEFQNRRFPRIMLEDHIPVTCIIAGVRSKSTDQGVPFPGMIVDLSGGGLSFISSVRLIKLIYLRLTFQLPGSKEPVELFAEIMRVTQYSGNSYRVAVEYRQSSKHMLSQVADFCKTQQNMS